jgi:predicted CopG family antitoxin
MNTTIAISTDIRDQIKEFGSKGETYDDILAKLLNSAKERPLQELLMDEKDTITVEEALARAKKRWQK